MPSRIAKSRLRRIERRIAEGINTHYQAAAVASDIFAEAMTHADCESEIRPLRLRFREFLNERGFDDLLERQIRYAIALAASDKVLLYEEMHKLFSLCDEIEALRYFGLKAKPTLEKELVKALRLRFKLEKRKACLVAEDKFEEWKKGWWYTDNLKVS